MTDGIYQTLPAYNSRWGMGDAIIYAIEGNVVDRASSKNGKGWCENVSPTLNTQDRHAVVLAIDQQGGKGNCCFTQDIMPTLLSDSHGTPHAVCFQQNQREEVRDMGECTGALTAEPGMHNQNYVCVQLCGDRDNPSVSVNDIAYCIPANPMSDRGQAVCYRK